MKAIKKILVTMLLAISLVVPSFVAQADSLNAMLKYSIYDLYTGEFIQDVNFLTHSSKDASIVQTVKWFNDRGIMMDPKRFNLKVNSNLTEYSTQLGNLSAYTADIMVYTTEADVLKTLDLQSETEPGVRNVIEIQEYEPERQMREAWEKETNSVPSGIVADAVADETSQEVSSLESQSISVTSTTSETRTSSLESHQESSQVGASAMTASASMTPGSNVARGNADEINTPVTVDETRNQQRAQNNSQTNQAYQASTATLSSQQSTLGSEVSQAPVVQKNTLPKTGESSDYSWLVALLLAGVGTALIFGIGKRRKS